jgi:8-oxo-dGTP diphosphatase
MNNQPEKFVIRVYGLIINVRNEILVTDEYRMNMKMTKFPGGGLNFGEGLRECLIREIKEECNGQELEKIEHFYTTDFFQKATFYENHQLISIYFLAELSGAIKFRISDKPFDFERTENGSQSFRWVKPEELIPESFTFPIDIFVAAKLKNYLIEKN